MAPTAVNEPVRRKQSVKLDELARIIRENDNYLIVSHMRPDGDCLGSTLGLFHGLRQLGKKVAAYNSTPLGEKWAFVPGAEHVLAAPPANPPEITIFVDCGGIRRVSDDFEPVGLLINIDHHLTNEQFGDYNYIDIDACAVGEQIFNLLRLLGAKVTPDIASCLFLSILTDTGGFRYSNTTAHSLRIAGELVAIGADPGLISQGVYESRSKGEFLLTAKAFSRLQYEFDDLLVWSELRWADYVEAGGVDSEPEGLASDIRGIRGVEVSCLFHETEEGTLRAGFRGKGYIDCSAIAQRCGGGGHFNASGTSIKKVPYAEAKERVLAELRTAVRAHIAKPNTKRV